jgi:hypothetical protein
MVADPRPEAPAGAVAATAAVSGVRVVDVATSTVAGAYASRRHLRAIDE